MQVCFKRVCVLLCVGVKAREGGRRGEKGRGGRKEGERREKEIPLAICNHVRDLWVVVVSHGPGPKKKISENDVTCLPCCSCFVFVFVLLLLWLLLLSVLRVVAVTNAAYPP